MSGYFEKLPNELMLDILSMLSYKQQTTLMKCSKALHDYIETEIYRSKHMRDIAMDWSLRMSAQTSLIRRLVEKYGASPSYYGGLLLDKNDNNKVLSRNVCQGKDVETIYPKLTLLTALKHTTCADKILSALLELGAIMDPISCPRSQSDIAEGSFKGFTLTQHARYNMQSFPRKVLRMPTTCEAEVECKLAALRYYYDTYSKLSLTTYGATPTKITWSLPRLIKPDNDFPIVKFILDREGANASDRDEGVKTDGDEVQDTEMAEGKELDDSGAPETSETRKSYPLVDRPENCGPHGAPISPLSAAILCGARNVFELLIEQGADINGPNLDFKKHGPTTHALHIPIFAAVYTLSRRKTNPVGRFWVTRCIELGADIDHMALCKLSGKHRPYRPTNESLGYYAQGMDYPPNGNIYFWVTPIDVFVDCLSLGYLRKRIGEEISNFDDDDDDETSFSARKNMDLLHKYHAEADLGKTRAPPRNTRIDGVLEHCRRRSNAGKREGPRLSIYAGFPTSPSLDKWHNWKRIVSPVTLEILLDRTTVSGMAHPVAFSYAEILKYEFDSGRGQGGRLLSKYDGPAPESRFPSWTSGSEAVGRRTLAMLLLCNQESVLEATELQRYIVYAVRRADMHFMENVVHNIEVVSSEMLQDDAFKVSYTPNAMNDDIEAQFFYENREPDPSDGNRPAPIFNTDQIIHPMKGWTAFHEICWMWNSQMTRWTTYDYLPRFVRQSSTTTRLLSTLAKHHFDFHQEAEDGSTPRSVLLDDPESSMSSYAKATLGAIADYVECTVKMLGIEDTLRDMTMT